MEITATQWAYVAQQKLTFLLVLILEAKDICTTSDYDRMYYCDK